MTQEAVIRALQNGPLTSYQIEDLTGIPRLSIAACCTKMSYKKKLKIGKVKMGRSWVSQYTLAPHMIEAEKIEEPRDLLNPCLLYTSPSPRDRQKSRMPSSA